MRRLADAPARIDTIPGLALHFEARFMGGHAEAGAVAAAPNRARPAQDFAQATGSRQPTFRNGGPGGQPYLRFDGTDDVLRAGALALAGSAGSLYLLMRFTNLTGTQTVFASCDEASTTRFFVVIMTAGQLYVAQRSADTQSSVRSTTAPPSGEWFLYECHSNGIAYGIGYNGRGQTIQVDGGTNNGDWFADTAARDNVTLGAQQQTLVANTFNGDLAAALVYEGINSPAESLAVRRYFAAAYRLPIKVA